MPARPHDRFRGRVVTGMVASEAMVAAMRTSAAAVLWGKQLDGIADPRAGPRVRLAERSRATAAAGSPDHSPPAEACG